MSVRFLEWWGEPQPETPRLRQLESPDSVGVCGSCDLDSPAEERHCGLECPLSVCEARARSRYGPGATVVYPRIVRYGVPTLDERN